MPQSRVLSPCPVQRRDAQPDSSYDHITRTLGWAKRAACIPVEFTSVVSTSQMIESPPGVIGTFCTVNNVALQQYSRKLYRPLVYNHSGLTDNAYYHDQAIRAERRGTVHVGPMMRDGTAEQQLLLLTPKV